MHCMDGGRGCWWGTASVITIILLLQLLLCIPLRRHEARQAGWLTGKQAGRKSTASSSSLYIKQRTTTATHRTPTTRSAVAVGWFCVCISDVHMHESVKLHIIKSLNRNRVKRTRNAGALWFSRARSIGISVQREVCLGGHFSCGTTTSSTTTTSTLSSERVQFV